MYLLLHVMSGGHIQYSEQVDGEFLVQLGIFWSYGYHNQSLSHYMEAIKGNVRIEHLSDPLGFPTPGTFLVIQA